MPSNAGPAAGDGFNELARYIFGGNDRCVIKIDSISVCQLADRTAPVSGSCLTRSCIHRAC